MATKRPLNRHLLIFAVGSLICAALFYGLFHAYAKAVLLLSSSVLELFSAGTVQLQNVPGRGFSLLYAHDRQPLLFAFDLFVLFLNLIFAPALVVTTIGLTPRGIRLALVAVAMMAALHVFHIVVLVLHFLSPTPNPVIRDLSPTLGSFSHWAYELADKMGYTLFPFVVWAGLCAKEILQWAPAQNGSTKI